MIDGVHERCNETGPAFPVGGDQLFELALRRSTSGSDRADLIAAHVLFNLAARKGHRKGAQRRLEIADEMSASEIAAAQRAARHWLAAH
jgi:hypothetical protein